MPERSAGLLMARRIEPSGVEFLIVHPGGPLYASKREEIWTIPKGLLDPGEDPLAAARREFFEETGLEPPDADYFDLGEIKQNSGKIVRAFGFVGDWDVRRLRSNEFELEWPPKSGRTQRFPEVDEARFVSIDEARRLLLPAQLPLIERLLARLQPAGAK